MSRRNYEDDIIIRKSSNEDDLKKLDEIIGKATEHSDQTNKMMEEVAAVIQEKYGDKNITTGNIMKLITSYKSKLKDDEEYRKFANGIRRILNSSESKQNNDTKAIHTEISKVLGGPEPKKIITNKQINLPENSVKVVEEIKKIDRSNLMLHKHLLLQTLTYKDCAFEAIGGNYDRMKDDVYEHIDPLIVAMFIPKIGLFEDLMLIPSLSQIILKRIKGEKLNSFEEELFNEITSDPNDAVCETDNVMVDLKRRIEVQVKLWECVRHIRNGKIYERCSTGLSTALESCRNNFFDSPDIGFLNNEIGRCRKLLTVFSIRPLTVVTRKNYTSNNLKNLELNGPIITYHPYEPMTTRMSLIDNVSNVQMINISLPLTLHKTDNVGLVKLEDALQQEVFQSDLVTKEPTKKIQKIEEIDNVLIFSVNRRIVEPEYHSNDNFLKFKHMPINLSGFEKANTYDVTYSNTMVINGKNYHLRSGTYITVKTDSDLIVGTGAALVTRGMNRQHKYILYDPVKPFFAESENEQELYSTTVVSYKPFTPVNDFIGVLSNDNDGTLPLTFSNVMTKTGTLFFYVEEGHLSKMEKNNMFEESFNNNY